MSLSQSDNLVKFDTRTKKFIPCERYRDAIQLFVTREAAAAEAMRTVLAALGPDLAAALRAQGNQDIVGKIAESIAPYAIAGGKPVSRAVSELLRGTTLESVLEDINKDCD